MDARMLSEIYHEETKYCEREMRKFQHQIDWNTQPVPYKEYASEKKVDLLPYLPFHHSPLTGKPLAGLDMETAEPFGLSEISRLLYFTHGVTAVLQYTSGQTLHMRAAPTAGGLYPTEIYLAARGLPVIEDGIYNFLAKEHALVPAWEGDFWNAFEQYCFGHEAIGPSHLLLVLTAVYQRSAWRYRERAYRRILLDTGHILGNLALYAPKEGFVPCPIGGFVDTSLNQLLFLEEAAEGVLAVVALPRRDRVDPADIPWRAPAGSRRRARPIQQATLHLELHRASSILPEESVAAALAPAVADPLDLSRHTDANGVVVLPQVASDFTDKIEQTILRRRSTRAFTGEAFLLDELASILCFAYLSDLSSVPMLFTPAFLETYLVVQKVIGLLPGAYHLDPHGAPNEMRLSRLMAGDFRAQTQHFCLGQELARDAAVVVVHVAHLKGTLARYGDRAYRYLHLDAGHIGQRLNLAAVHLGLGASGIGGFYDDEVNGLLGLSLDHIVVYVTTLGRPQGE